MAVISLDNPVVQSYIVYSAILALKLLFLSPLTGMTRMARGVFANPEDVQSFKKGKVKFDDPAVERIRRAHLNDLENIPAFWVLGALYLTTNPVASWATLLFRVYTAGRVLHTIVYAVKPLPQPSRAIAFFIPFVIMVYMGVQVVLYYITAL
uniref:Microsomal glutathione S-transferase 1 n=1 Tax=Streltzoviella insularis TaxID=1206366 RepID=A0A7D5UMV0_9NEOP|nr:glutathione S-transferase 3 [Streltzoviella insularis]